MDYYNSKEQVEKLIGLGSISSLGPYLEPDPEKGGHSFEEPQDYVTVFYGRDRGEEDQEAKIHDLKYLEKNSWANYFYIFTKEGRWEYFESGELKNGFRDLENDLDVVRSADYENAGCYSEYKYVLEVETMLEEISRAKEK